jgi:hypothetical protein
VNKRIETQLAIHAELLALRQAFYQQHREALGRMHCYLSMTDLTVCIQRESAAVAGEYFGRDGWVRDEAVLAPFHHWTKTIDGVPVMIVNAEPRITKASLAVSLAEWGVLREGAQPPRSWVEQAERDDPHYRPPHPS